jgi:hypothetical protein
MRGELGRWSGRARRERTPRGEAELVRCAERGGSEPGGASSGTGGAAAARCDAEGQGG